MPARSQWFNDVGEFTPMTVDLEPVTIVFEQKYGQILKINGVVILPVGSTIELTEPNAIATVVGVRMLGGNAHLPVTVCLDVEVPDAFWSELFAEELQS